jgi:hypothetical protein
MLPSFCSQTVDIVRAKKTKTVRGSDVPDWSDTVTTTVTGCSVQPASSSLSLDGRVLGITDAWTAYVPAGTDVKAGDHIKYRGKTYEIQGEPRVWVGAFNMSHIQLNLVRWEG